MSQLYARSNSVVSRVIAGETLIVPIRSGIGDLASIYSLNTSASRIWQSIETPSSEEEIVERLEQEFACSRPQLQSDVAAFLAEMQTAGLIESRPIGGPS